jgi:hypothetical protein
LPSVWWICNISAFKHKRSCNPVFRLAMNKTATSPSEWRSRSSTSNSKTSRPRQRKSQKAHSPSASLPRSISDCSPGSSRACSAQKKHSASTTRVNEEQLKSLLSGQSAAAGVPTTGALRRRRAHPRRRNTPIIPMRTRLMSPRTVTTMRRLRRKLLFRRAFLLQRQPPSQTTMPHQAGITRTTLSRRHASPRPNQMKSRRRMSALLSSRTTRRPLSREQLPNLCPAAQQTRPRRPATND